MIVPLNLHSENDLPACVSQVCPPHPPGFSGARSGAGLGTSSDTQLLAGGGVLHGAEGPPNTPGTPDHPGSTLQPCKSGDQWQAAPPSPASRAPRWTLQHQSKGGHLSPCSLGLSQCGPCVPNWSKGSRKQRGQGWSRRMVTWVPVATSAAAVEAVGQGGLGEGLRLGSLSVAMTDS